MPYLSEEISGDMVKATGLPPVEFLIRQPNGDWTFHFRLNGEVELPDGRRVIINRRAALRATEQVGRKRAS